MNKYQEALDTIKDYMILHKEYGDEDNITRLNKYMIEDLQELIDDTTFIKHELESLNERLSNYEVDCITCKHDLTEYNMNCQDCIHNKKFKNNYETLFTDDECPTRMTEIYKKWLKRDEDN